MWFECLREDVVLDLPDNSVEDRIRIAVLDTGISVDDDFIHMDENLNRITYRSFVTGDPNPTEASDLDGHGTHVAGLLLRVARNANIYVAKISKKDGLRDPQEIATQVSPI